MYTYTRINFVLEWNNAYKKKNIRREILASCACMCDTILWSRVLRTPLSCEISSEVFVRIIHQFWIQMLFIRTSEQPMNPNIITICTSVFHPNAHFISGKVVRVLYVTWLMWWVLKHAKGTKNMTDYSIWPQLYIQAVVPFVQDHPFTPSYLALQAVVQHADSMTITMTPFELQIARWYPYTTRQANLKYFCPQKKFAVLKG